MKQETNGFGWEVLVTIFVVLAVCWGGMKGCDYANERSKSAEICLSAKKSITDEFRYAANGCSDQICTPGSQFGQPSGPLKSILDHQKTVVEHCDSDYGVLTEQQIKDKLLPAATEWSNRAMLLIFKTKPAKNRDDGHWPLNHMSWLQQEFRNNLKSGFDIADFSKVGIDEKGLKWLDAAYRSATAKNMVEELENYPAYGLEDSPNKLLELIIKNDPSADSKKLTKLANQAYARMAERMLNLLRDREWPYPQTKEAIATMRDYLKLGGWNLAHIGTSERELACLTREFPRTQCQ